MDNMTWNRLKGMMPGNHFIIRGPEGDVRAGGFTMAMAKEYFSFSQYGERLPEPKIDYNIVTPDSTSMTLLFDDEVLVVSKEMYTTILASVKDDVIGESGSKSAEHDNEVL